MSEVKNCIPFDEFSENLARIFERVISEGEVVVVETKEGELVEVKPVTSTRTGRRRVIKADDEAFLASAGSWKDVDVDAFLKDNEESRRLNTRPRVDL